MKLLATAAAAATLAISVVPVAHADTVSKNLQVSAVIEPFCAVNTFALNFGVYGTSNINGGQALEASGSIYVLCPADVPYTIALDNGGYEQMESCTSLPARFMTSDVQLGGSLPYQLFSEPTGQIPWGCTQSNWVSGVGNGDSFVAHPVYGKIEAGMVTLADTYSDTVVVTVTF